MPSFLHSSFLNPYSCMKILFKSLKFALINSSLLGFSGSVKPYLFNSPKFGKFPQLIKSYSPIEMSHRDLRTNTSSSSFLYFLFSSVITQLGLKLWFTKSKSGPIMNQWSADFTLVYSLLTTICRELARQYVMKYSSHEILMPLIFYKISVYAPMSSEPCNLQF